jgi:prepilin-type N-terminal cleavage/methylation domain-containing protein
MMLGQLPTGSEMIAGQRSGMNERRRARAFTLVEMLVAIALVLVLAGMALLVVPSATDGQATVSAASQLQQWIEIAKGRAARDRAPRGIRLLPNPNTSQPTYVANLEYLEQPDFYDMGFVPSASAAGANSFATATVNTVTLPGPPPYTVTRVEFTNASKKLTGSLPITAANASLFPVQGANKSTVTPCDYLELNGIAYKIDLVAPAPPVSKSAAKRPYTLTLVTSSTTWYAQPSTTPPPPNMVTTNYRIIRRPRPIGDDPMEMPQNIVIDVTPRFVGSAAPAPGPWDLPIPQANAPLDIVFSPDGKVMSTPGNNLAVYDKIIFWVRDITVPDGQSDPTLVVIYPKTGLVASYPVDLGNLATSPYTFVSTGKKS